MLASPEEIPATGLPPLNSATVCRPLVIANNSQNSDDSPSEPPASLTNEAMESDRPSNISGKVSDFFPPYFIPVFVQRCDSKYNKLNTHKQEEFINIIQFIGGGGGGEGWREKE